MAESRSWRDNSVVWTQRWQYWKEHRECECGNTSMTWKKSDGNCLVEHAHWRARCGKCNSVIVGPPPINTQG